MIPVSLVRSKDLLGSNESKSGLGGGEDSLLWYMRGDSLNNSNIFRLLINFYYYYYFFTTDVGIYHYYFSTYISFKMPTIYSVYRLSIFH